jgi:hypothetical protein
MKLLRYLSLYGLLIVGLTACPFLEAPEPLAPLTKPKTQKQAYKSTVCRIKSYNREPFRRIQYEYDAEGKPLRKITTYLSDGVFPERQSITTFTYDANGFLVRKKTEGPESGAMEYKYDANGQLIVSPTTQDPNVIVLERDAAGRETKANYYGTLITTRYNAAGHTAETNSVDVYGNQLRALFDDNGNATLAEMSNQEGVYSATQYTYDDKPKPVFIDPELYFAFKGFPPQSSERRGNNLLSMITKDGKGVVTESQSYTYTYSTAGYPVKGTWKVTRANPFPGEKASTEWTNEYEGCIQ